MSTRTATPFLDMQQVAYAYGAGHPSVDNISWQLLEGAIHCLVGRSGCGKSTLLNRAARPLRPQSGHVRRRGRKPAARGPQLGYRFRAPPPLEWQPGMDNV